MPSVSPVRDATTMQARNAADVRADRNASLLYICGGGHSGSTLLDLVLGQHPDIVSVGEVSTLNRYIERHEYHCSCGRAVRACDFWQAVMAELDEERSLGDTPEEAMVARSRTLPLDMRHELADSLPLKIQYAASGAFLTASRGASGERDGRHLRRVAPAIMRRMDDAHRLFDAIRRVSGVPVVLDSSKHAYRLRLLRAARPEQVRCLFLARDGRARTHSDMRREGMDAETAARRWVNVNRKSRRLLAQLPPSRRLDVTYEALCRDTRDTLAAVCAFAGLAFDERLLELRVGEVHNIGGNRARFGPLDAIREDTRWRDEMAAADLATFERIGGALNRELLGERYRD